MTTINKIQIRHVNSIEEARTALAEGWCPIECSFGLETVVDDLQMDHHGPLSHLTPISIRAYTQHFGARRDDPRFVVTGNPGADDIFAILALAGLLPHPTQQVPPHLAKVMQVDLIELAQFIAKLDRDPVGVKKSQHPWGAHLIIWGSMSQGENGIVRHNAALWLMLQAVTNRFAPEILAAAKAADEARIKKAEEAPYEMIGRVKLLENSPVPAPDVYYGRLGDETDPNSPEGWAAPVVVTFVAALKRVTFGAANEAVAIALYGEGGFKAIFAQLGNDWGGAEAIGGSPRGQEMTVEDAGRIAQQLSDLIKK